MRSEREVTNLYRATIEFDKLPEWFITKPDNEAIQKTLKWVLEE